MIVDKDIEMECSICIEVNWNEAGLKIVILILEQPSMLSVGVEQF